MDDTAALVALAVATLNALASVYGGWCWWTVAPSGLFWVLARLGQGAAAALALLVGVLAAAGYAPADGLFWLYALLPVAVSLVGEQFRIASAATVLEARELEDARAVGRLDEDGQRSVVLAIVRREIGVAALAALVVAFLALRAAGTA
jgi:hypothetical protein